jgi:hypothetical protein
MNLLNDTVQFRKGPERINGEVLEKISQYCAGSHKITENGGESGGITQNHAESRRIILNYAESRDRACASVNH